WPIHRAAPALALQQARQSPFATGVKVIDLLAPLARGGKSAMFGGAGVFADGLMIALVVDGVIFLKADAATIPPFEREGMAPFNYGTTRGTRTLTSYWRMPERLYDDADELAGWARHAMDAARRSGGKSSKRKKS
ncbi:MAG: TfoX/Sxy family protein, partial [Hyphomicrobiales bacterium]